MTELRIVRAGDDAMSKPRVSAAEFAARKRAWEIKSGLSKMERDDYRIRELRRAIIGLAICAVAMAAIVSVTLAVVSR